ncbi:hypothetical protein [uncultured Erythrobacter sp.]|uniref:hypothetical protein n=1 Tax=uncultured Erythrobacter sp. TaxID=263913 RepID=UPI002657CCD2|nr:hypothetical protein [uncultured Erythrobacter sp.]
MGRRTERHEWADHPELLTSLRTPWDKFRKADWNFSRYEYEVSKRPCHIEDVSFAALDFCVSLTALRDWTKTALAKDCRAGRRTLPSGLGNLDDWQQFLGGAIPWLSAIEAIANTTKHGKYRDDGWPKGIAMLATFVPPHLEEEKDNCQDGLALFNFMQRYWDVAWWDIALRQHGQKEATPGNVAFREALDAWQTLLTDCGFNARD